MNFVLLGVPLLKFLGSKMGIRLLLLLVVGLGALYTIHLLAGDFMRLQTTLTTGENSKISEKSEESSKKLEIA